MSTKDSTTTSTEIHLVVGEVWSGKTAPGLQIVCKQGIVWLTQSDDPHDHFLHPGQRFLVTCHGKVVVQALTAATISRHNPRSRQITMSVLGRAWQHLVIVLTRGAGLRIWQASAHLGNFRSNLQQQN